MAERLKKGDISIIELLQLSAQYYQEKDNKKWRAEIDVISAKITARNNLSYNPSTHKWEQIGREIKFIFIIRTDPISYKKGDSLKYHYYPVIFLLRDFDKGITSPFRSRVGGLKRWKSLRRKISEGKTQDEKNRIRKENKNDECEDIYCENGREELIESDEIDSFEEAFMRGYEESG